MTVGEKIDKMFELLDKIENVSKETLDEVTNVLLNADLNINIKIERLIEFANKYKQINFKMILEYLGTQHGFYFAHNVELPDDISYKIQKNIIQNFDSRIIEYPYCMTNEQAQQFAKRYNMEIIADLYLCYISEKDSKMKLFPDIKKELYDRITNYRPIIDESINNVYKYSKVLFSLEDIISAELENKKDIKPYVNTYLSMPNQQHLTFLLKKLHNHDNYEYDRIIVETFFQNDNDFILSDDCNSLMEEINDDDIIQYIYDKIVSEGNIRKMVNFAKTGKFKNIDKIIKNVIENSDAEFAEVLVNIPNSNVGLINKLLDIKIAERQEDVEKRFNNTIEAIKNQNLDGIDAELGYIMNHATEDQVNALYDAIISLPSYDENFKLIEMCIYAMQRFVDTRTDEKIRKLLELANVEDESKSLHYFSGIISRGGPNAEYIIKTVLDKGVGLEYIIECIEPYITIEERHLLVEYYIKKRDIDKLLNMSIYSELLDKDLIKIEKWIITKASFEETVRFLKGRKSSYCNDTDFVERLLKKRGLEYMIMLTEELDALKGNEIIQAAINALKVPPTPLEELDDAMNEVTNARYDHARDGLGIKEE